MLADLSPRAVGGEPRVLGFHPWPYHAATPDVTDELRIDLDPSPGVDFEMVREGANEVKALLDELGIAAFPKTTGSRGIHIYANVGGGLDSYQVRSCRGRAGPRTRAPPARPHDVAVVEGRTRRARLHRLQPELPAQDGVRRVGCARQRRRPGQRPVHLGRAADRRHPRRSTMATVPARLAANGDPWAAMYARPAVAAAAARHERARHWPTACSTRRGRPCIRSNPTNPRAWRRRAQEEPRSRPARRRSTRGSGWDRLVRRCTTSGSRSGRKRRNDAAWRIAAPWKWPYATSTTSSMRTRLPGHVLLRVPSVAGRRVGGARRGHVSTHPAHGWSSSALLA